MDNGLKVNFLPRADFHKTYGILTTDYGSVDNEFVPLGETEVRRFPDGIAHFLEHKLFEKEDHDAFELFGRYGGLMPMPLPVLRVRVICFKRHTMLLSV